MNARTPIRILALTLGLCLTPALMAQTQSAAATTTTPDTSASASERGLLAYERNTVDIVKKYGGSVVAVNVIVKGERVNPLKKVPPQFRPFFQQFLPPGALKPQQLIEQAAGSGFVVDSEDQIITNYHVVRSALKGNSTKIADNAKITVRFPGATENLPVKVTGVNESYDLALLTVIDRNKIPKSVRPLPLGNSDHVLVGEKAIAIGNPFGLESTVTQGIVSAINRRQAALVSGVPIAYIQTDAPINPGNSGGPLLNSRGQVIGINDEILAPNGTFIGVGFAIPSNVLRSHLKALRHGGFIRNPEMGVEVISLDQYPKSIADQFHLPDHGVMVVAVLPGSPAAKAGLRGAQFTINLNGQRLPAGGDIIVAVDGKPLKDATQLQNKVFSMQPGQTVKLTILRDGRTMHVRVRVEIPKKNG